MSTHEGAMGGAFQAASCPRATVAPAGGAHAAGVIGLTILAGGIVCSVVLGVRCAAQAADSNGQPGAQAQVQAGYEGADTYEDIARQGEWGRIDGLARARLAGEPGDVTALYWLGAARFQIGDTIGALQALRAAQAKGLASAQMHLELGQVYYKLNQFALFEQQMEQASHLDPQDGTAQYLLGFYQLSVRSDVGRALILLRQAAALRPEDGKTLYELGDCLELSGASAEAKEVYLKAIALASSKRPFAWPYQGLARLVLNEDPHQAMQLAREAVRLEPGEASNHLVLAKSYERLGELSKAVSEAREAASRNPSSASTRYLLFRLYHRQGELAQADQELKAYHEIDATYGPE